MLIKHFLYRLKFFYHLFVNSFLSFVYSIKYHFPQNKLKFIIVTGTDGKTTSCNLIYHLIKTSGHKVSLISTVSAIIGDQVFETGLHNTCPEIKDLYALLYQMKEQKTEYVILEATSQGIFQNRIFGLKPLIVGITNITRDHFDYHLNYKNYFLAKQMMLKRSPVVVLNQEDQSYSQLLLLNKGKLILSYNRDVKKIIFKRHLAYLSQQKGLKNKELSDVKKIFVIIKKKFCADFNQSNAVLASQIVYYLGFESRHIIMGLESFSLPKGRQEVVKVKNKKNLIFLIDFAHTPNGVEKFLVSVRKNFCQKKQNLITVAGCTGRRDVGKRPQMGLVLASLSDLTIFTSDDTRDEKIEVIINQMKQDLHTFHHRVLSVSDREQAIATAIKIASPDSIICLCGKGHEKSICLNNIDYPWDEKKVVLKLIKEYV